MNTQRKYWNEKKQSARQATVINVYRQYFGEKVSDGKQYWTLSGQCADEQGDIVSGCELDHVIRAGLIVPEQFHGVDRLKYVYEFNQRVQGPNWYRDDLFLALKRSDNNGTFNPAVLNYDSLCMPRRGIPYFGKLLNFLAERDVHNVLAVGNLILRNPNDGRCQFNDEEFVGYFLRSRLMKQVFRGGWQLHLDAYKYHNQETWMRSIFLVRY